MTSSYLALEQTVHARQADLLKEAEAARLHAQLPARSPGWRRRLAVGLYALAGWLNGGALEVKARRGWNLPAACADLCNGVEYWCGFPPPLVH